MLKLGTDSCFLETLLSRNVPQDSCTLTELGVIFCCIIHSLIHSFLIYALV